MTTKCEVCNIKLTKSTSVLLYSSYGFKHNFCKDCAEEFTSVSSNVAQKAGN